MITENSSVETGTAGSGPRQVPVGARHVCVLFRRFESFGKDMTRPYLDALEARGIAHLLVGGRSFHDCEEVATMRSALSAVEWPDDELSVFATLRGSLFAIDDETLFAFHHHFGRPHPFRIPPALRPEGQGGAELDRFLPVTDALELLQQLHRTRNHVPVAETVGRLLQATRAHAGFAMRPAGEQALANVLQIAEMASRLLKNTRIGLFSWPSCVSRPPPDNGAHGDTLSRRGGQRHPRPAIRDTSPPDSATGPSDRRWRRR